MAGRDGWASWTGAWRRPVWMFLAVGLIPTACSGDSSDGRVAETTIQTDDDAPDSDGAEPAGEDGGAMASDILPPAEIDPMSEYVFGLCRLDPVSYFGDDDPLTAIAAAIQELPAVTAEEQTEVAFLVSSLTIAADADNIVESTEMQQVVNLMAARCN